MEESLKSKNPFLRRYFPRKLGNLKAQNEVVHAKKSTFPAPVALSGYQFFPKTQINDRRHVSLTAIPVSFPLFRNILCEMGIAEFAVPDYALNTLPLFESYIHFSLHTKIA